MNISMLKTEGEIRVFCPYSRSFVDFAHMRNGAWSDSAKCWTFDPRDEYAVRRALIDTYGTDDYASCDKVDVSIDLNGYDLNAKRKFICGREVISCSQYGKIVLGEGVVLLAGGLSVSRRGSIDAENHTIIEVRGVPRLAAEQSYLKKPEFIKIINGIDTDKLTAERADMLKRIEEIDKLLASISQKGNEDAILDDLRDDPDGASTESD